MSCSNNDLAYLKDIDRDDLLEMLDNPIRKTKVKISPLRSEYGIFEKAKPKTKWKCSCGNMNNEQNCLKCGINRALVNK